MPQAFHSRKRHMMMTSGIFTLLLVFIWLGSSVIPLDRFPYMGANEHTLQQVHIVMRHGPRTPVDAYPNDPYRNETFYPHGRGQLTHRGKRDCYNAGTFLRKRYEKFMNKQYTADVIHAQSTGVTRTQTTLQLILASWFAPKGTISEWTRKLNWQPIPIAYQPLEEDNLLLVRKPCPRYFEALKEVYNLSEVKAEIMPYQNMFKELENYTGLSINDPDDVQSLYFTLLTERQYGFKLPEWTRAYFPEKMKFLTEQAYIYNVYTPEMQKFKAGPFLDKMFTNMLAARYQSDESERRKVYLYVGHDATLVNIMHALHLWEPQIPKYLAMVIFELHKNPVTDEYYVEIYYRSKNGAALQQLTMPDCEQQCLLDTMLYNTKHLTSSYVHDCQPKDERFHPPSQKAP